MLSKVAQTASTGEKRELLSFWAAGSQPSSKKAYKSEQLPEGEVGLHQPPHSAVRQEEASDSGAVDLRGAAAEEQQGRGLVLLQR